MGALAPAMPTVSIIIPTLDEETVLPSTLAALRVLEPAPEIIVVDGGSTDGTRAAIERTPGVQFLESPRGRARQMNAGAAAAPGDWLLFLHADTVLAQPAYCAARAAMAEPEVEWGWFGLVLDDPRVTYRVHAWLIRTRARQTGKPTGDQAIFVRRDVFAAVHGYPDIPFMEDVALVRTLHARTPGRRIAGCVVTSARRWRERGLLRTILHMWSLKLQFLAGRDPRLLAESYPRVR